MIPDWYTNYKIDGLMELNYMTPQGSLIMLPEQNNLNENLIVSVLISIFHYLILKLLCIIDNLHFFNNYKIIDSAKKFQMQL